MTGGLGTNPSIAGASAAENRYLMDGLDTTDPVIYEIWKTRKVRAEVLAAAGVRS